MRRVQNVKVTLGKMPRGLKNVREWSKWQRFVAVMAIIALVFAIWLAWWLFIQKAKPSPKTKLTVAQVNVSVTKSLQAHKYTQAQQTIADDALNPADRNNLLLLVTVYEGEKDYRRALSTLQQIQTKYGMDYVLAINLGQVEQLLKDKVNAIKYYQQAVTLIQTAKPPVPNADVNVASLQTLIKGLQ